MFELYSADGRLQLDSINSAYYVASQGVVTTNFSWPPGNAAGGAYALVDVPADSLLAVRCTTAGVTTAQFDAQYTAVITEGFNQSVEYFIFRKFNANNPSSSGVGLELYDANFKVTFSTVIGGGKLMRLLQIYNVTSMAANMNTWVSTPTGKKVAFVINPSIRQQNPISGNTPTFNITSNSYEPAPNGSLSAVRAGTNGFWLREVGSAAYTMGNNYNGNILAIDVTGY